MGGRIFCAISLWRRHVYVRSCVYADVMGADTVIVLPLQGVDDCPKCWHVCDAVGVACGKSSDMACVHSRLVVLSKFVIRARASDYC
jgi:hypothetical protein